MPRFPDGSRSGKAQPTPIQMATLAKQAADARWVSDRRYAILASSLLFGLLFYLSVPEYIAELRPPPSAIEIATSGANPVYRLLKFALLGASCGMILWRLRLAVATLKQLNLYLLLFVALVTLSIGWSITPQSTVLRLAAVVTIMLVSWGFVLMGWHQTRFQVVLRSMLTGLLTAALLFCVLRPDLAKEAGEGISLEEAWRGMFASKNMFGQAASIASVLWLHAYLSGQVKFLKFAYGMAVGMTSLVLSHSSTALGSTFFVMALELLLLSRVARNSRAAPYLIGVFVVALLLYSIAALNLVPGLDFLLTPITAVTGKDSSFSGRTIVWSYVRAHIEQHPILGTGYGAYWIGPIVSSPSYVFILAKMPYPPEAHNGYLDIINDLGYVGLACLLGYLWIYLKQCFALLKIDFTQAVLFIALLFQQLVGNLTESMWFASSSLNFAVMTLATFALARTSVEQQIRPVPQAAQRRRAVPGRRNRTSAAAASR